MELNWYELARYSVPEATISYNALVGRLAEHALDLRLTDLGDYKIFLGETTALLVKGYGRDVRKGDKTAMWVTAKQGKEPKCITDIAEMEGVRILARKPTLTTPLEEFLKPVEHDDCPMYSQQPTTGAICPN